MTNYALFCLVLICLLLNLKSHAIPESCSKESVPKTEEIVSVSVGFGSYQAGAEGKDRIFDLPYSANDATFYHELGQAMTKNAHRWDETAAWTHATKADFLKKLKETLKDAKVINFNYAGHGARLHNGQWALALPSLPARCAHILNPDAEKTEQKLGPLTVNPTRSLTIDNTDSSCANYIVTTQELEDVFQGRPVFGIVDSCYSGAIALKNQHMLVSSRADQLSSDSRVEANGAFTRKIKELLQNKSCKLDSDHDGQVSLAELTAQLPPVPMPQHAYPKTADGQDMGYNGKFEWAKCLPLSGAEASCRDPIKVGDVLEIATSNAVARASKQAGSSPSDAAECHLQAGDKVRINKVLGSSYAVVQLPANRGCPFTGEMLLGTTWNKTAKRPDTKSERSTAQPAAAK